MSIALASFTDATEQLRSFLRKQGYSMSWQVRFDSLDSCLTELIILQPRRSESMCKGLLGVFSRLKFSWIIGVWPIESES
jgi:hypothetical protein